MHPRMTTVAITTIATLCTLGSSTAPAAETPKRKSGLWEITNTMNGPHAMSTSMQQCVDQNTDKLMEQSGRKEAEKSCSKNDVRQEGGKVVVDSVCKFDNTTATTHAEFTGDFGNNYRGDIKTTYNPPMQGMKEMQMTIAAKWLGPCKPGMKPGDIVVQNMPGMPGGMKFNPADLQKQMRQ